MNKFIPLLIFIVFTTTSCSKFFAVTIVGKEENKELNKLVFENDSMKIEFYLSDNNFTPQFQYKIVNKLSIPIFVDWKNSVTTFDNVVRNYEGNNSIIDAHSIRSDRNNQDLSGVVQNVSKPNIVPPNSFLLSERLQFYKSTYSSTEKFANVKEKEIKPDRYVLSFYLSTKIGSMSGVDRFYNFKFWISKVMLINVVEHQSKVGRNSDFSTYVSKVLY
jgi:hypothetical protein